MKLAYSTNGFTRVSLPEAIRRIAAHGYEGVEILADAPHWCPPHCTDADLRAIEDALGGTRLAISNVNVNTAMGLWPSPPPELVFEPSLSNRDPAVRRRRIDYTFACLELAAVLGAPAISVASGRMESDVPPARGFDYFARSLEVVCERAAALGVRVGIEFEPGLLVETSDEVARLIEMVDHPALGANLDIGHAVCAGEDPVDAIARLAGRIWNVHIEDIRGRKHYHLIPGEGDIEFARVIDALRVHGYDGFLTVELYTCTHQADSAARAAIGYLAPLVEALDTFHGTVELTPSAALM